MSTSFWDNAFSPLTQAMHVRAFRQELLAGNIANANTPGYRARDLDFGRALAGELGNGVGELELRRTNSRQLAGNGNDPLSSFVGYRTGVPMGIAGNNVDLSQEENRFTSNALAYEVDLKFLSQRISQLKLAIKGS